MFYMFSQFKVFKQNKTHKITFSDIAKMRFFSDTVKIKKKMENLRCNRIPLQKGVSYTPAKILY